MTDRNARPAELCVYILFVAVQFAAHAESRKGLEGFVRDAEGASIARAQIVVRKDLSGTDKRSRQDSVVTESDERGRFEVAIEPGLLDVCVMADAFNPQCRKIYWDRKTILEFRLIVNTEVIKRLGDKVYR